MLGYLLEKKRGDKHELEREKVFGDEYDHNELWDYSEKKKNIKILIPSVTYYSVKSVFFSLQVFV